MTKKTKIIFVSILFIQTLIIISILLYIFNKRNNAITITPLKSENLIFPQNSLNLKYFYESKPSILQYGNPDWLPYTATYTINKDGLNERFDYSTTKPPNVLRIITLGDSFTFGALVNTPDNWTEKLEALFQSTSFCKDKKIEVINLGLGGYDMEYSVARLKLTGIKYGPDMVLWLIKDDDFTQINEIMKPTKDKYRAEFKAKGSLDPAAYPWIDKVIKETNEKYGEQAILNRQIEILRSITDVYKNKLLLMTFPFTQKKYKKILLDFKISRPQTYFYDKLPDIRASDMTNAILPDGHPSVEGHSLIALSVFEYLKTNKLIPCR